ncbi:hypothetical protein OAF80_00410 [bacterium]|nr:hypothetical protein [bacterium]
MIDYKKEVDDILTLKWIPLNRETIKDLKNGKYPGVYVLAISSENNITDKVVEMKDVFYIGMSNAKNGVKSRLKQFLLGVEKGTSHSAGMRFKKEKDQKEWNSNFYFAAKGYECNVVKTTNGDKSRGANDLRIMGDVAKLEYELLAIYKEVMNKEPDLNKK